MNKISKYLPTIAVLAIVVTLGGIQYYKNQKPANEEQDRQTDNRQNLSVPGSKTDSPKPSGMLEGVLKISDDLKRGNLMLVQADHIVYLFTSRDYSQLFEKEVKVEIDGSLENFRLVDIKEK
ncbi:MAG: hypothetical protein AAB410_00030 [Patescibacteria group bacterium]